LEPAWVYKTADGFTLDLELVVLAKSGVVLRA